MLLFALADVPSLRSLEINDSATLAASLLQLAGFDTVSGTVFLNPCVGGRVGCRGEVCTHDGKVSDVFRLIETRTG